MDTIENMLRRVNEVYVIRVYNGKYLCLYNKPVFCQVAFVVKSKEY